MIAAVDTTVTMKMVMTRNDQVASILPKDGATLSRAASQRVRRNNRRAVARERRGSTRKSEKKDTRERRRGFSEYQNKLMSYGIYFRSEVLSCQKEPRAQS